MSTRNHFGKVFLYLVCSWIHVHLGDQKAITPCWRAAFGEESTLRRYGSLLRCTVSHRSWRRTVETPLSVFLLSDCHSMTSGRGQSGQSSCYCELPIPQALLPRSFFGPYATGLAHTPAARPPEHPKIYILLKVKNLKILLKIAVSWQKCIEQQEISSEILDNPCPEGKPLS